MITVIGEHFRKGFYGKYVSVNKSFSITHDVPKLEFEQPSVAQKH